MVADKQRAELDQTIVTLRRAQADNEAYRQTTEALSAKFSALQTERADLIARLAAMEQAHMVSSPRRARFRLPAILALRPRAQ